MPPARLNGIQALRAAAALAVVVSHLVGFEARYLPGPALLPGWCEFGQFGVDLFFVLSGFIIVESTHRLHGSAAAASLFLYRRLIRIYPVYWVYLAPVVLLWLVNPTILGGGGMGRDVDLMASVSLYPGSHILLVSWTLTFELYFYLVFALVFALVTATLPRERLPQILVAWAVLTAAGVLLVRPTVHLAGTNVAFDWLVLEFLAGGAVALLRPHLPTRLGPTLCAAGVAGIVFGAAAMWQAGMPFPGHWPRVAVFGTASAILLAGVLALEPAIGRRYPAWMLQLGDASYSLYLGHLLVIAVAGRAWKLLLPHPSMANHLAALGGCVLAASLLAVLSFRLVEAPLLQALRPLVRLNPARRLRPA
jgi:exopolysaccharide production protein ExoZ